MRTYMLMLAAMLAFVTANAQGTDSKAEVFTVVEQMPEYAGGTDSLMKYLSRNIHYPEEYRQKRMQGTVFVRFVVSAKGEIQDVTVMRGAKDAVEFDKEAVRVISDMPRWNPGKQGGRPVAVFVMLPVKFVLN